MRKLCKSCRSRPAAINYYKNGETFYRSCCDHCNRVSRKGIPKWYKSGYRKKTKCDRCGYSSKHPEQFDVYHVDGNLNNCRFDNLKSVCANCQRLLHTQDRIWKQGHLVPDL